MLPIFDKIIVHRRFRIKQFLAYSMAVIRTLIQIAQQRIAALCLSLYLTALPGALPLVTSVGTIL